jgi:hypothetical protein
MSLSWMLVVHGDLGDFKPSVLIRDGLDQVPDGVRQLSKSGRRIL